MKCENFSPINYYSCQNCQRKFISEYPLKIIPNKFPLCFKCKNNLKKQEETFVFFFGRYKLIFDEEGKNLIEELTEKYELMIKDGYLLIDSQNKKLFFHRLLMEDELEIVGKEFHIHHLNQNKLDNRKENLSLMRKEEHYKLHEHERYMKGYRTWIRKKYGEDYDDEGEHLEEFDEWLMKQGDIW